jgi:hypothetical protein
VHSTRGSAHTAYTAYTACGAAPEWLCRPRPHVLGLGSRDPPWTLITKAIKLLGWPRRYQLAHAFRWEYSCERLELAQLLGRLGISFTKASVLVTHYTHYTHTATVTVTKLLYLSHTTHTTHALPPTARRAGRRRRGCCWRTSAGRPAGPRRAPLRRPALPPIAAEIPNSVVFADLVYHSEQQERPRTISCQQ